VAVSFTVAGHPASPNQVRSKHWRAIYKHNTPIKNECFLRASSTRPTKPYQIIRLAICLEKTGTFYDDDNAVGVCKVLQDAVVRAGWVVDDSPGHVQLEVTQRRGWPKQARITITPLDGEVVPHG
jgi:hypothetical protein